MNGQAINTGLDGVAVAETQLSAIDGEAGNPYVRGYPIGTLATEAVYEECPYLLFNERLHTAADT